MENDFQDDVEEKIHTHNRPVPLVTFEEGSIRFDENVARETFANPVYRDSKISLVSVMGPSRSGKSFLMSLLTNGIKDNSIRGAFQSGMEPHTEGILIFMNSISIGENHVIFFLDTQGTFDMKTDRNVSAWIAGFSLLISDIQMINLVGNIGGNDLHDIHLFVETAAALKGSLLTKALMFVIRDTPGWDETTLLEKIWTQCENSSDLKMISESLRERFPDAIECFCTSPASDNIRYANEYVELEKDDLPLINSFLRIKRSLFDRCRDAFHAVGEDLIQKAQEIVHFLQNDAPRLESTVTMGQEASVAVAVNRACEAFRIGLKGTTADTLEMSVLMGRQEVSRRLKELLKENNIPVAQSLVDLKIEKLINEKRQEFKNIENDKLLQRKGDEFLARWRGNIWKLLKLNEALEMKKSDEIRKEAAKLGLEIPETSFQLLQNRLNDRIVILQSQFINSQLAELNSSMRHELANVEMQALPSCNWVEQQVTLRVKTLKDQTSNLDITDAEWRKIELEARETLNVIAQNALEMIELRIQTRKREETRLKELEKKENDLKEQAMTRQDTRLQEAQGASQAAERRESKLWSEINSLTTADSIHDSKPEKISQEEQPLRQTEEHAKRQAEIERRFREEEQELSSQTERTQETKMEEANRELEKQFQIEMEKMRRQMDEMQQQQRELMKRKSNFNCSIM